MPCYTPLSPWQMLDGSGLVWNEAKTKGNARAIQIPCGQCIGCRLERSRQWAVRCIHEASLYENNCFITLTYDNEHLPKGGTLVKKHYQDFMKRLRYHYGAARLRYYMCGEYGTQTWRPHYHALLFNHEWEDKKHHTNTAQGHKTWTSRRLDEIWGMGQCITAALTFESAAYTSRYITTKITGDLAETHYKRYWPDGTPYWLEPEYNEMSRDGGIGKEWLEKYNTDVYNHDTVIINGRKTRPVKYYDNLYKTINPQRMEDIKMAREIRAYEGRDDNTPERLKVKEEVTRAAIRQLTRNKA